MSGSYDKVVEIIAETADISPDTINPESHVINDLGIDSLDFLDIVFAIDKAFGIKLPIETWMEAVNSGEVPAEHYFILKNLCARIDSIIEQKSADAR